MSGWLYVITGPMFSGKTEALLHLIRRYAIMGKQPILFRPSTDTRTTTVESRSGASYPAFAVSTIQEIDAIIYQKIGYPKVVAFDEAQFFLDIDLPFLIEEFIFNGTLVLVSGLDRDFLKRPFGYMDKLLIMADEVVKYTAVCAICKEKASLTQRLINGIPAKEDDPLIVVGGMVDDSYEARCRNHHEIGV